MYKRQAIRYEITADDLESYRNNMVENEKSAATIEKYIRDILSFCRWNQNQWIDRIHVLEWKKYLISLYAVSSVNSMLAALNSFFHSQPYCFGKDVYKRQPRCFFYY